MRNTISKSVLAIAIGLTLGSSLPVGAAGAIDEPRDPIGEHDLTPWWYIKAPDQAVPL